MPKFPFKRVFLTSLIFFRIASYSNSSCKDTMFLFISIFSPSNFSNHILSPIFILLLYIVLAKLRVVLHLNALCYLTHLQQRTYMIAKWLLSCFEIYKTKMCCFPLQILLMIVSIFMKCHEQVISLS